MAAAALPGGKGQLIGRALHLQILAERFQRQDVNRNGYLSAGELVVPSL